MPTRPTPKMAMSSALVLLRPPLLWGDCAAATTIGVGIGCAMIGVGTATAGAAAAGATPCTTTGLGLAAPLTTTAGLPTTIGVLAGFA